MKGMKKVLAVACAVAMACPITAFAAPLNAIAPASEVVETVAVEKVNSGAKIDVANAKVTVDKLTYNGSQQTAKVTVTLGDNTLKNGKDYVVTGNVKTKAGSYTLTVYGIGKYTGSKEKTFKIAKADQQITVTAPSVSAAAVANSSKTYKLKVSGVKGNGKVSYSSSSKAITINSDGKITVKKGTKKGTKATITVSVASSNNYNAVKKSVTIKVTK